MSKENRVSDERLAEMLVWCTERKEQKPWYGEGDDSPKMVTTCDFMISIICELQSLRLPAHKPLQEEG